MVSGPLRVVPVGQLDRHGQRPAIEVDSFRVGRERRGERGNCARRSGAVADHLLAGSRRSEALRRAGDLRPAIRCVAGPPVVGRVGLDAERVASGRHPVRIDLRCGETSRHWADVGEQHRREVAVGRNVEVDRAGLRSRFEHRGGGLCGEVHGVRYRCELRRRRGVHDARAGVGEHSERAGRPQRRVAPTVDDLQERLHRRALRDGAAHRELEPPSATLRQRPRARRADVRRRVPQRTRSERRGLHRLGALTGDERLPSDVALDRAAVGDVQAHAGRQHQFH
jgi:hypothetical protein